MHPTIEKTTASWMKEAQKGYIRIGVLILLNKEPAHGYELMKEIKARTGGFWKPTAGGIYPILRSLEKSRYIKGEWQTQNGRNLRVYKITDSGKLVLKNTIIKQREIFESVSKLFQEFARDVLKIEAENLSMPAPPSFFQEFLEDKKENTQASIEELKQHRKHVLQSIRMMKQNLKTLNAQIAEKEKTEKSKAA